VPQIARARIAPNWTSAAGALEGILAALDAPLPRQAVMGLTGHAWHTCLGTREGVTALPSGPADLDWEAMTRRYARTGFSWARYSRRLPAGQDWAIGRSQAIDWAIGHLDAGRPLIGWDFHLHEHAVIYGYDAAARTLLVDDLLSERLGAAVSWDAWPSELGIIELLAPLDPVTVDPLEAVHGALATTLDCFAGRDGPEDGQPRGTAALTAWADAFDSDIEVDRAGNAYTLAVLQAARLDGADFLADLALALPDLAGPLSQAERAIRDETKALAPLLTLFPFPTGGHGNVANPGLRRSAGMALRRAAQHESRAAQAVEQALQDMVDL
jgi:hypothetical protein